MRQPATGKRVQGGRRAFLVLLVVLAASIYVPSALAQSQLLQSYQELKVFQSCGSAIPMQAER
jgi:hypothetical protein